MSLENRVGDIGLRIAELVGKYPKPIRPTDFARDLQITPQRLNGWLRGQHDPPSDMLPAIALRLGKTVEWLLGTVPEVGPPLIPAGVARVQIPLIGTVTAGDWADPTDSEDFEYVDFDMAVKGAFCCWIDGDSMYDFLWPGDLAIWKKWEIGGQVGDVVVARDTEGRLTVKQLRKKPNGSLFLHPLNKNYSDQPLRANPLGYLLGYIRVVGTRTMKVFDPNRLRP